MRPNNRPQKEFITKVEPIREPKDIRLTAESQFEASGATGAPPASPEGGSLVSLGRKRNRINLIFGVFISIG